MAIIPRNEKFFELFNEQAECVHDASIKLVALLEDYREVQKRVTEIEFIEHRGDQLTHTLMQRLNMTFITPIDREDIHALSSALDDILDLIDGVASRMIIYKVKETTPGARQLARVIQHGSEILLRAIKELNRPANILEYCRQLKHLEHEGDRIKAQCVGKLFEDSVDPIEVIKWKEIYEVLEITTDKIEDVSDILETVLLKST
ncbi:MAG: DUF47 domain-containing protein [Acidobacteria bacterium]|nr:DUF47 domain-containing protein [Acidobacteriota bacterium]